MYMELLSRNVIISYLSKNSAKQVHMYDIRWEIPEL